MSKCFFSMFTGNCSATLLYVFCVVNPPNYFPPKRFMYHQEGVVIDIICIMWWCATVHCHHISDWTCLWISWLITNFFSIYSWEKLVSCSHYSFLTVFCATVGLCSGTVGRGPSLEAGRLWVKFVMGLRGFFMDLFLLVALWPWGQLSLWQNWGPVLSPGGWRWPVRMTDDLTTFMS